ncbi:MAG: sulfatase [Acidobacteriota bacterium]|nr:sulfatase [Acidobacteriota bacterium]MDH3524291.1 sulfatase [Acidobacteriota bacterium]
MLPCCAALSLLAGCGGHAPEPATVAPARNLAVLCLDTVRYDVFSLPETAGLEDRLAPLLEDALVFEHGQSPAPWTVPAVASLLTGLYPNQHGAGRFDEEIADLSSTVPAAIRAEVQTLPELLSAAGFATAAFVAHPWFRTGYGLDRGFGSLELGNDSAALTRRSLRWLDDPSAAGRETAAGERPFFVYLHFMEAHERYRQPVEQVEEIVGAMPREVRDAGTALAAGFACGDATSERCRRLLAYVDTVLQLRAVVADFLAGLAERRLLDDTVVVVYSDHGEEFDDHLGEERAEGLDPRSIYGAGHGHTLYQELLHVPLAIWRPGVPGRRVATPVTLVDLVPSLADWLAASRLGTAERELPGRPIDALVAGEPEPSRALFSSGIAYGPRQLAVFDGRRKRIHFPGQGIARLFDLERDPGEKAPLHDRRLALPLDRQLSRYLALTASPARGESPEIPPDLLEQLQSLGYLEGAGDRAAAADEELP